MLASETPMMVTFSMLRKEDHAAAGPLTSADGTLTSTTGALLTVGLGAAARDVVTVLGGVGTLTLAGVLANHDLVDAGDVRLDAEDAVGELGLGDLSPLNVLDGVLGHSVLLVSLRV